MVKARDQLGGRIGPYWVNKSLQAKDKQKLKPGVQLEHEILLNAGAYHVFKSLHFAAHPGDSVRIRDRVDADLQTRTENLYVYDALLIPEA